MKCFLAPTFLPLNPYGGVNFFKTFKTNQHECFSIFYLPKPKLLHRTLFSFFRCTLVIESENKQIRKSTWGQQVWIPSQMWFDYEGRRKSPAKIGRATRKF